MKRILGLDLGTSSIGWALVNESEDEREQSSIIKLGVRVNPLTVDEQRNFEAGKPITTNAERTLKRSMRRNLQRYKLRRDNLIEILTEHGFITPETILAEQGNKSTFETYRLRAKAVTEEISLEELARVLLMINKKRGYKSSRKLDTNEDGKIIDGMEVAKQLYDEGLTPGQYMLRLMDSGKRYTPDFYRSDLKDEFGRIWDFQKTFYPELLTDELRQELAGKNEKQTWAICAKTFSLVGLKRTAKGEELKRENYKWRVDSLSEKMDLESLTVVLQKINGQINGSSGYLGEMSDRSKELYFKKQTVGQYLMSRLDKNSHYSLKNKVFYRQDYLDEFEMIWENQARYHSELTDSLKHEIRDVVIFYQRSLKSQKGLISFCEFENRQMETVKYGKKRLKTVGLRVCPKSSPLFQEFKIWQILNNIQVSGKVVRKQSVDLFGETVEMANGKRFLYQEEKEKLFRELNIKAKMSKAEVLKLLFKNHKELDLNYKEIEGNRTQAALFAAYQTIIDMSGHGTHDFSKMCADDVMDIVSNVFGGLEFGTDILCFDSSLEGKAFERQPAYRLWHLLYSFAGDNSKTGNEKLISKISELYGFDREYAAIIAGISFQLDYGSLSAKAIRKILPYMKEGNEYSVACGYAGYRHSKNSLTKEELANKLLCNRLKPLPRNSLRNPVVEKILNQMINVVNSVANVYGKPDEIRIEMARELKNSAKEREEMTKAISKATADHEYYRQILKNEFGIENVSRNDIIRYKLYMELKDKGFKTLYSNTYIPREKLFSKEFDIEHIIPQARLFDDSFSNKTIEVRSVNIEKGNMTAYDYVCGKYDADKVSAYKVRVEELFKNGTISKTKRDKLLMSEADIPSGFIERDLRDSQYIARKAREILESLVRTVVPTTGSITSRLREDWQLVDVMKELNWDKYNRLGLTDFVVDKDGRRIRRIKDWTKRNDHRHHAMDALTIAFTKPSYIQYLNNMNARSDKGSSIYAIEKKELYRDNGKLKFQPPMPLDVFRAEAKRHLDGILVSIKAKNKVVTRNTNVSKIKGGTKKKVQLTPRGQLHNETVYGRIKRYVVKEEKVNASFDMQKIDTVANMRYRMALSDRLQQYGGNAKKAFTGSNSLQKNPLYVDDMHIIAVPERVKTVGFEYVYTIRKEVTPDLKIDKVVDSKVRNILKARLEQFANVAKKAFVNLDENPIWLNKEKGIAIKRVTITGVSNALALHDKRDNSGKPMLDVNGHKMPVDFVSPSNNHHVAIYMDADGKMQDDIVSFYEATMRANQGYPVIDRDKNRSEGWQFLFTMKQNEYFVFPNEETGFDPNEIDLLDPNNYPIISPNLFRVQKLSKTEGRIYMFRHHLETTVDDKKELQEVTWKRINSLDKLKNVVKVRVDHVGRIVSVGEY